MLDQIKVYVQPLYQEVQQPWLLQEVEPGQNNQEIQEPVTLQLHHHQQQQSLTLV